MQMQNKPVRSKTILIIKYCLVAVFLLIGLFLILRGYDRGQKYLHLRKNAVQVRVEEGCIQEKTYSDGDCIYYVCAKYTYDGQKYEILYDSYGSYKRAVSALEKLSVLHIDPDEPTQHMKEAMDDTLQLWLFGGFIIAAGVACWFIPERKHYVASYGWLRRYVEMDLFIRLRRRIVCWLPAMVFSTSCLLGWGLYAHWFLPIVGLLSLGIGLVFLSRWLRNRTLIQSGDYRIGQDVLVEKSIARDEDGKTYYLHYSNGENKWRCSVKETVYHASKMGDTIETVYLHGQKRPFLAFCSTTCTVY